MKHDNIDQEMDRIFCLPDEFQDELWLLWLDYGLESELMTQFDDVLYEGLKEALNRGA
jgi:hypothetical protein